MSSTSSEQPRPKLSIDELTDLRAKTEAVSQYLRKRLEGMIVVTRPPDDRGRIYFGAWVRVEDDNGNETEFRIVGPDELDPARRYVSMDSPLARALMGKRVDDEVTIEIPGGRRAYVVVGIRYEEPVAS